MLKSRLRLTRDGCFRIAESAFFRSEGRYMSASSDSALWLPFTANQAFKGASSPRMITSGKGMYFYDEAGRPIMDSAAGLWCSAAGISPAPVVEAVQEQVAKLSYAPTFQIGHEAGFDWAEAIVDPAHSDLKARELGKVFFTMCGSTSVDTALKMALAYHRANGEATRTRFIGRERAYHGVGIGGISVGGIPPNRAAFSAALMHGVDHLPHTHSFEHAFTKGQPDWGAHLADNLEDIVMLHSAQNIAAVIVEPVAGSAGVLVPPKGYLEKLRTICDKHGILLIFDEVITGFGRLGTPFASSYFDVTPDIFTLAKGLTGAVVPAGAVVAKNRIYDTIVNHGPGGIEFFHGYTYSGHPVACAAGMAMIKLLTEGGVYAQGAALVPTFEKLIHEFFDDDEFVVDVRNLGLMGAVQLATPPGAPIGALGSAVLDHAWHEEDLYVRVSGDTIAFSPAFIATEENLVEIFRRTKRSIHEVRNRF